MPDRCLEGLERRRLPRKLMNMKKWIMIALAIALLAGAYVWFFVINKSHHTAADDEALVKLTSQALYLEFKGDEKATFAKYKDQIIQVSGELSEIKLDASGDTELVLNTEDPMAHVIVTLKKGDHAANAKTGTTIEIKGICNGFLYEELLETSDVLLNQGVLVEKTKE
jgi:flagellar basal body-associated protein FliL